MLRDSFNFFKTAVSIDYRAQSLFSTNREFCLSKGITLSDIKKDIAEFYLYPNQNKPCHSQFRIKYIVGKNGKFEVFFHPDDVNDHSFVDKIPFQGI